MTLTLLERRSASRQLELPGEHGALLDIKVLDSVVKVDNLVGSVGSHDVGAERGKSDVVLAVTEEAVQHVVHAVLRVAELAQDLERRRVVFVVAAVLGRSDRATKNGLHLGGTIGETGHVGVERDFACLESDRGGSTCPGARQAFRRASII